MTKELWFDAQQELEVCLLS